MLSDKLKQMWSKRLPTMMQECEIQSDFWGGRITLNEALIKLNDLHSKEGE